MSNTPRPNVVLPVKHVESNEFGLKEKYPEFKQLCKKDWSSIFTQQLNL
jgi:hypothetical protein